MNLLIKNISDDDIYQLTIPKDNTILDLKTLILSKINSSKELDEIQLIYSGQRLENSKTLKDYKINNGSTLSLVFKLKPYQCCETQPIVNRPRILFTIITTGILNWGTSTDEDEQNLIRLWIRNRVLSNLIKYIPDHFQIEVIHLDPLFDLKDRMKPLSQGLKTNVTNLIENDNRLERVYKSSFSQQPFNPHESLINITNPYVVIDFPNLFIFTDLPGRVIFRPTDEVVDIAVIKVNPWDSFGRRVMKNAKLLEVDREGRVTTFIDKLIMDGIYIDVEEPIRGLSKEYETLIEYEKRNYEDKLIRKGYELGSPEMIKKVKKFLKSDKIRQIEKEKVSEIFSDIWRT